MEFRQLETFIAVVEAGSFSQGAELLYLTQPTVTAHISGLEQELGRQLLIRSTKGLRLTEAGQKLYNYARSALAARQGLLADLAGEGEDPLIRVAASSVPSQCLLPQLMADFRQQQPEASFSLLLCDSAEVGLKLIAGQAEVGFCGSPQADCLCLPIVEDELCVITPAEERFRCLEGAFPPELLFSEPMLCREEGSGTRAQFQHWLDQHGPGKQPHIVAQMADALALKNAVAAGLGLAIYSRQAAADYAEAGRLLCFPLEGMASRSLYLARPREGRLSPAAAEFFTFTARRFQAE